MVELLTGLIVIAALNKENVNVCVTVNGLDLQKLYLVYVLDGPDASGDAVWKLQNKQEGRGKLVKLLSSVVISNVKMERITLAALLIAVQL